MNELWIAGFVVLWILVLVLAFFVAGALRQLAVLQLRFGQDAGALITVSGLDRGVRAPDFEARDPETGAAVRLSTLARRARVLVFVTPTCTACAHLIPHLNEVVATRGAEFDFLTICRGDPSACISMARINGLEARMLVDESGDIERAYEVSLTPFSYLLDYRGRVLVRGVANDWTQLEALLDQQGTQEVPADSNHDQDPEEAISVSGISEQ